MSFLSRIQSILASGISQQLPAELPAETISNQGWFGLLVKEISLIRTFIFSEYFLPIRMKLLFSISYWVELLEDFTRVRMDLYQGRLPRNFIRFRLGSQLMDEQMPNPLVNQTSHQNCNLVDLLVPIVLLLPLRKINHVRISLVISVTTQVMEMSQNTHPKWSNIWSNG